ncbi:hypothetical protein ABID65_006689 [Bradyrhizobium sp. S3.9.2]|uniref:hypothetical protein n=1 Tax=Bradyrhizobium sp. S3.9.2 TaxID=3156432 RepID=UPI0033922EB0
MADKAVMLACEHAMLIGTEIAEAVNNADVRLDACTKLAERVDDLQQALHKIAQWAEAYPLTVFPEPDLAKARVLLETGGITLDSVSAHCMRHVVEGVGKIARAALR